MAICWPLKASKARSTEMNAKIPVTQVAKSPQSLMLVENRPKGNSISVNQDVPNVRQNKTMDTVIPEKNTKYRRLPKRFS